MVNGRTAKVNQRGNIGFCAGGSGSTDIAASAVLIMTTGAHQKPRGVRPLS